MLAHSTRQPLATAALFAALLALAGCTEGGTGATEGCTKQADCKSGELCRDNACVAVPCLGACGRTEVCDGSKCVPADGYSCASGSAVCPGDAYTCTPGSVCQRKCTVDTECPVNPFRVCNPESFFCGECASKNDCKGAKKSCDGATATCVECLTSEDCRDASAPGGRYCEESTHTCKPGCTTADNCGPGQRCKGATNGAIGKCIECEREDECIASPRIHCEKTTGMCVECTEPGSSQCLRDCDLVRHTCVECVKNQTCQLNAVCDNTGESPFCTPGCAGGSGGPNCDPDPAHKSSVCDANRGPHGLCVECLVDADCPRTKVCDVLAGTAADGSKVPACVPGCKTSATDTHARCKPRAGEAPVPVDVLCDPLKGTRGTCVECKANADCHDPLRPTCDATSGLCRCAIQGEDCTASASCGELATDGSVRCNAQFAGTAFCISQVDCSGALCGGTTKNLPKSVCALKAHGLGTSCTNDPAACPQSPVQMVSDNGIPVEAGATKRAMCVPQGLDCK